MKHIGIILTVLFLIACKSQKDKAGVFTLPGVWPPPDSILAPMKERIRNGAVEYFTINDTKFRFQKSRQSDGLYDLDVQEGDKWLTNLVLPLPQQYFAHSLTQDLDKDGYYDLSTYIGGDVKVYFFDSATQKFSPNAVQFPYDYALLDKGQLIYGANRHGLDDWNIQIFSLKTREMKYLYSAKLFHKGNTHNGGFAITNSVLYKCENNDLSDTALIEKTDINKQFGDFSLLYFMKNVARYGTAKKIDAKPQE